MYSKKMRARLRRAARLERTKQILEATAQVGQTLRDALEPDPEAEKKNEPPESFVEGTFRVVEEAEPEQPAARGAGQQEVEVTITTPHEPGQAEEPVEPKQPPPQPPPSTAGPEPAAGAGFQPDISSLLSELRLPLGLPERLREWTDKIPLDKIPLDKIPLDKIPIPQSPLESPETVEVEKGQAGFIGGTYTNAAGTRSYKLYVPSGYHGQALPLVVMLHGCTQSPDDFAVATRMNELAEKHNFFAVYPAQIFKANMGKCWNWFKETEQQRAQGEPAIIAGLTRHIIDTYGLDSRRVYVTGISAGGAMAMVMGMTCPDLYAAVGVQSGVGYAVAHNVPTGLAAIKKGGAASTDRLMKAAGGQARPRAVPTIVFHGDADSIVHPNNGEQIIAQWLQIRAERGPTGPAPQITVHQGQAPAGRTYTRSVYHDQSGPIMEHWLVHGAGHAWSGGSPNGSFTDPQGPDASQEMLRFFYEHPHPEG